MVQMNSIFFPKCYSSSSNKPPIFPFSFTFFFSRYIQILGPQYYSHCTTRECGTWGLRYGNGNISGSNSIWEYSTQSGPLPMNTTSLQMFFFVAKLLGGTFDTNPSLDFLFSGHESLTAWEWETRRGWARQGATTISKPFGFLICTSRKPYFFLVALLDGYLISFINVDVSRERM